MHQQLDMAVVAILSHGENGSIICTNGEKVKVQLVFFSLFTPKFLNKWDPSVKSNFIVTPIDIDPGAH